MAGRSFHFFCLVLLAFPFVLQKAGAEIPLPREKPDVRKSAQPAQAPTKQKKARATPSQASRLKACPALIDGRVSARYLPPVRTQSLCGDEAPLEVSAVGGVALKPAAQLNCSMTGAVAEWVGALEGAARSLFKQDLKTVRTAASYSCRRRNNSKTGKFSEHATMNALDVSGFELADGTFVSVLEDWPEKAGSARAKTRFLKAAHAGACKRFTTVLGPDSDPHHENHFHVDLGCHGKKCTFRLCR